MPIDDTMPGDDATRCCPRTSTVSSGRSGSWPRISATISSGSAAIGSTRPRAPSRRPTRSRPCDGVAEQLPDRDDHEVAERVALEVARCRRNGAAARRARCGPSRCRRTAPTAPSAGRRAGSTSNSSRSRPLEPPSSATVTTAVTLSVSSRRAVSAAARPWPPPSATMRRWCGEPRGGRGVVTAMVPVTPGPGRGGRRTCRRGRARRAARSAPRRSRRTGACRPCTRRRP